MESLGDLPTEFLFWLIAIIAIVFLCFLVWKLLKRLSFKFPLAKIFSLPLVVAIAGFGVLCLTGRVTNAYDWEALHRFISPFQKALVVIVFTLFALGYIEYLLKKFQKQIGRLRISKGKFAAIRKFCHFIIYFIALAILFQLVGLGIGPILTFGGIGVAALALASQDILSNFFGGIMIFFRRPFYEGDAVVVPSVSNFKGTVREIGLYATLFEDENKRFAYFPNSLFCKSLIINQSKAEQSLITGTLQVGAESRKNLDGLIQEMQKILSEHRDFSIIESEFTEKDLTFKFTLAFDKLEREEFLKKKAHVYNQMYDLVSPLRGSIRLIN